MALIHWQPWQEVETLRRQFDQLFDDLAPVSRELTPTRKTWSPAIELQSTEAAVVLRAELPGIAAKDLDVQVTREAVSISGEYRSESKTEDPRFFRSEFRYGTFHRVVPLPVAVQNDAVNAEFKDGILTLTLPKVQAERPKVVKINLGDAAPTIAPTSNDAGSPADPAKTDDLWTETAHS